MTISRDQLVNTIGEVLQNAARGKGTRGHYLTAYQILRRLPEATREALIAEYGPPGRGAGKNFTAVSRVAQVAREIAHYDYLDAGGITFDGVEDDAEDPIRSGYPVIGIYRAKRPEEV